MMKHLIVFLLGFLLFGGSPAIVKADPITPESYSPFNFDCQLPPPSLVSVTAIGPTTVNLQWTPVSGAVSYKVSMFDATANIALPDEYTSGTTYTYGIITPLTPGHNYVVGVSASACNNDYGVESHADFTSSIIIIDTVVQNSCPAPGSNGNNPNTTYTVYLVPQTNSIIQVSTIQVSHGSNQDDRVVFNLWADCEKNIHYTAIGLPETVLQDPAGSGSTPLQTSIVDFLLTSTHHTYFKLIDASSTTQYVTLTVKFGTDIPRGNLTYCNFVSMYNCGPHSRAMNPEGDPVPEVLGNAVKTVSGKDAVQTLPTVSSLNVSPNPFSGEFQVQYALTEESPVTLSLLDLNGKVVKTMRLPNALPAGDHTAAFQTEDLPAGMYFLVLQTDQERRVTTLVKQ